MWQCLSTACLNIAKIIKKQQEVSGITTEINQTLVQITTKDSKPFDYKTSITGKLEGNNT